MENKIKWKNHKSTFFEILKAQREKSKYTDATLVVDGNFYPIHKLVMSTCSEYFSDIFEKTSCKSPVIVLKDVPSNDIEALLDYVYQGEVDVNQNDLASLLKTANSLRIKGLGVLDEYQTELSQNSTSIDNDDGQYSRPLKRRRQNSCTIPQQAACPNQLSQNTTTSVISTTPKKLYPKPPDTENLGTADTTSSVSYSTKNIPNANPSQPTEVKDELEDVEDQEIGVISRYNYNPDANTDVDPDKVSEFNILKIEHDPENDDSTCFPEPCSLEKINHSTTFANQGESLVVKIGLDGVKEKYIGSSDDHPFANDRSDFFFKEKNEELYDAAFSARPSLQRSVIDYFTTIRKTTKPKTSECSKRKVFTNKFRREIIQLKDKGWSNKDLCKKFALSSSTCSTLYSEKSRKIVAEAYANLVNENTVVNNPNLKPAVIHDVEWIVQTYLESNKNRGVFLTENEICDKALEVFKYLMNPKKGLFNIDGTRAQTGQPNSTSEGRKSLGKRYKVQECDVLVTPGKIGGSSEDSTLGNIILNDIEEKINDVSVNNSDSDDKSTVTLNEDLCVIDQPGPSTCTSTCSAKKELVFGFSHGWYHRFVVVRLGYNFKKNLGESISADKEATDIDELIEHDECDLNIIQVAEQALKKRKSN